MGVMTLALSAFSIVPMAISFVHREFLSQVVTHMRREFKDDEQNGGKAHFFSFILETFLVKISFSLQGRKNKWLFGEL